MPCVNNFDYNKASSNLEKINKYINDVGDTSAKPDWKRVYNTAIGKIKEFETNILNNNATFSNCIITEYNNANSNANPSVQNKGANKLKQNADKYKYMDELIAGSKVRFDDHQFVYNNNIFKMLYLSSGILTMSFLIFKVIH